VALTLWTIGHSTRPIEELLDLLNAWGISLLVDVRLIPFSRRNPQFNTQALAESVTGVGLQYHHLSALGGRRKAWPDSINLAWRSAGFRGYADYMQTAAFREALEELMAYGRRGHTVIMCAEAVPWRCHRMLIADALIARGWTVHHILSAASAEAHSLTPFARLDHHTVTYPPPDTEENAPRLW